jgi:hypothetical protein
MDFDAVVELMKCNCVTAVFLKVWYAEGFQGVRGRKEIIKKISRVLSAVR